MSGIVIQTKALKVTNSGGGSPSKTFNIGRGQRTTQTWPKQKGTDYVIFNCPGCGKRNKHSMYEVKGKAGDMLSFRCHGCYNTIDVEPPKATKIILDPNSPALKSGIVGPDGRPV